MNMRDFLPSKRHMHDIPRRQPACASQGTLNRGSYTDFGGESLFGEPASWSWAD